MQPTGAMYAADSLPEGYCLHWYRIERVLGRGGFGITYLAKDTNLDHTVAIKEYLPSLCASRSPGDSYVRPHNDELAATYAWGLKAFITEAQTLAKFNHPNIVRVLSVFEQLGTAYMVMEYEPGDELAHLIKQNKQFGEIEIIRLTMSLLDGLKLIHAAGFIHRDIKPQNIVIRPDGSPVLLDFGSARQAMESQKRQLTSMVTSGYAPIEQYNKGDSTQGAWTDIYGMAATLHTMIMGSTPPDAVSRATEIIAGNKDPLPLVAVHAAGRYSTRLLSAIDAGLKFHAKDRPQSVAEWIKLFTDNEQTIIPLQIKPRFEAEKLTEQEKPIKEQASSAEKSPEQIKPRKLQIIYLQYAVVAVSVITVGLWAYHLISQTGPQKAAVSPITSTTTSQEKPVQPIINEAPITEQKEPVKTPVTVEPAPPAAPATKVEPPTPAEQIATPSPVTETMKEKASVEPVKPPAAPKTKEPAKETIKAPPLAEKPKPVVQIEQTAPKLLESIVSAFNTGNERQLYTLIKNAKTKAHVLHVIFNEYETVNVGVQTFSILSGDNEANALLRIESLTTKDGGQVEPAASWRDIKLKIKISSEGHTQAFWQ